jgi:dTDP-4-dehydrorhamnose reductase
MVTGAGGQLGADLVAALEGEDVLALRHSQLDIADSTAVNAVVEADRPDIVINAAAYTAVDAAEADEDAAYRVNATGPALLASALARRPGGPRLIHVSTDYVFAGDASAPYNVDAPTGPRSAYGRTKLAGEQAVRELLPEASYVVRTAWVYGASGPNFVKTMARLERERDTLDVVDDQRGSPTWSAQLATSLVELGRSGAAPGYSLCTGAGESIWFVFARAIFAELGADPERVRPTSTGAFPRPAPRPAYSVLSDASWRGAGLRPLPDWRDGLRDAFRSVGERLRGN